MLYSCCDENKVAYVMFSASNLTTVHVLPVKFSQSYLCACVCYVHVYVSDQSVIMLN